MKQEKSHEEDYGDFLKQKVDDARESIESGEGKLNARVEAEFARIRSFTQKESGKK